MFRTVYFCDFPVAYGLTLRQFIDGDDPAVVDYDAISDKATVGWSDDEMGNSALWMVLQDASALPIFLIEP